MQVRLTRGIIALDYEWTDDSVVITPVYGGVRGAWDRFVDWMIETVTVVGRSVYGA